MTNREIIQNWMEHFGLTFHELGIYNIISAKDLSRDQILMLLQYVEEDRTRVYLQGVTPNF